MKIFYSRKTKVSLTKKIKSQLVLNYLERQNSHILKKREFPMAVFANDWIGTIINLNGFYEEEEVKDLFYFLESIEFNFQDSVAYDIGANIGNHSVQFANRFAKVFSFEPNQLTFKLLQINLNPFDNVKVNNFGFGRNEEHLKLTGNFENVGGATALPSKFSDFEFDVQIKKLDDFVSNHLAPNFIKIDVEGMEIEVLEGGENTFLKHRPMVAFEANLQNNVKIETNSPVVQKLLEWEYKIFWLEEKKSSFPAFYKRVLNIFEVFFGETVERRIISGDKIPSRNHSMLIGIPKERIEKLLNEK